MGREGERDRIKEMEELGGGYYELREMERDIRWQHVLNYYANKDKCMFGCILYV